jgi:hypothetical protein
MPDVDHKSLRSRATDKEALATRARNLTTAPTAGRPNGIKLLFVKIEGDAAKLTLHFYNENYLQTIVDRYNADHARAPQIFPISGGHRLPAGTAGVRVQAIAREVDQTALALTVRPIGDYSTYKLRIDTTGFGTNPVVIDPLFNEIDFKFRPGCFNINCKPDWPSAAQPDDAPVIDYLAKDYDSFRHTMIAAMMQRVPNWQPSSEADLDQVLLELFSAAADELSDYQDRVMNEAYLSSARKRISLARHARLMDYHIHQGNQAATWLALEVLPEFKSTPETGTIEYFLAKNFQVWAPTQGDQPSAVVFVAREKKRVHELVNRMGLYTWGDAIPSLVAGDTTADLKLFRVGASGQATELSDKASAIAVQKLIRSGVVHQLLIQEHLNPATGTSNGFNPRKRQLLTLLPGADGAEAMYDPTTAPATYDPVNNLPPNAARWFVRVRWAQQDQLKSNYCFTVDCPNIGKVENVSLFHGNLVEVSHGRLRTTTFKEPGPSLKAGEFYYERSEKLGAVCTLPDRPLAYQKTKPGGDEPTQSTLSVEVLQETGGKDAWDEVSSLIHSDASDENGDHFVVETDEERISVVRFGNGSNGRELPQNAVVECTYQVGDGLDGNIGLDKLTTFDPAANHFLKLDANVAQNRDGSKIIRCWNPFDVDSGRAPEPAAEIIRRAPEAYRLRQLRAVTLDDYVKRAMELPEVSRASAAYAWTGSWRTVRITIDPAGATVLEAAAFQKIARHLNAVRLIGEDLEIRSPQFVPLKIAVVLCAKPEFWCEDLKAILEQEFSDGWTPDGRRGFFHPDLWTFGQGLEPSQIVGRVLAVEGVEHLISVNIERLNSPSSALTIRTGAAVSQNEIIQVFNDPDHMEKGSIDFDVQGGRQ